MAADKVLADAFARYGQAMGYAQAATDTSNFMLDFLTDIGNEWIKEKEEDKKKFKSYAKDHQNIMNKLPGVSHLKDENYETLSNKVFELVEQGDLALENGDKNGYNQVMQQLDQLKGEMLNIETLFTNLDGDLSAASGTEAPHKIFLGEWKLGFDNDGRITAAGLPNAVGGVDEKAYNLQHFLDRLTPNKSAEILQTKENGLLNIMQRAKTYELFDAKDHDPQINTLINSYTEDEDLMMSVIHDNVFGLTDENGNPILVKNELEKMYPDRNEAYMFEYNRNLTEEDPDNPNKQKNVYDADKLRNDVRAILKKHLVKEFNEKVKTFIPQENIIWDNRVMNQKDFNKAYWGAYNYIATTYLKELRKDGRGPSIQEINTLTKSALNSHLSSYSAAGLSSAYSATKGMIPEREFLKYLANDKLRERYKKAQNEFEYRKRKLVGSATGGDNFRKFSVFYDLK